MTFATMLRELRDAKGWSEVTLARESGVGLGTIHNYVQKSNEGRLPTLLTAAKLARALGVSVEKFLECDEFQFEVPEEK